MNEREKIRRRVEILRNGRRGARDLSGWRRGVRRELGELLGEMSRAQNTATHWLSLAMDMRREGYLPAARVALDYARTARLVAVEVERITSTRAWERA